MTRRTALGLGVASMVLGLATHRSTAPSSSTTRVTVVAGPQGRVVVANAATEFAMGPGGCIEARLLTSGGPLTLDEAREPEDCSSSMVVDGREEAGLVLDFGRARVSELGLASGGPGRRIEVPGRPSGSGASSVETKVVLESRDAIPNAISLTMAYRNAGAAGITLERLTLPGRRLAASGGDAAVKPHALWSFHGASERVGQDEVVPVTEGLSRENAFGLPGPRGVGGGIPVVAFWSASVGTAFGHTELLPVALSIPVEVPGDGHARTSVVLRPAARLEPGESYETPRFFHAAFAGDYYEALRIYADLLESEGGPRHHPSPGSYEPNWCSWGYGEDVTPARMLGVLPKLHDLQLQWAVLDDRWFDAFGDWRPRAETFPGDSLKNVVDAYHAQGVRLQVWWVPLAVETGAVLPRGTHHRTAQSGLQHPEWLVLDEAGRPARTSRGLSVFCPAVPEVRQYHRRLVERFIGEWGFDGHKLDTVFSVPRCYNPQHAHRSPDDSVAALRPLYAEILSATRALKPDAVVQICSCGTTPHHAWLPFLTQAVAADPWGSAQRRERIKMYKGLLGPNAAISGDHSELAETASILGGERPRGQDFASTVGMGGVVSTRFVWPEAPSGSEDVLLTPEKEVHWKKWLAIDRATGLSRGTFLNLYRHGFDLPEAYCIEKGGRMHYAFYTPEPGGTFDGTLELRGLGPGRYHVRDYVEGRDLGIVTGEHGTIRARFTGHLLLVATALGS